MQPTFASTRVLLDSSSSASLLSFTFCRSSRVTMSRPGSTDMEQAKVKKLLDQCLKEPGNRLCAECNQKRPLWASSNLGVFVCIRCSGIHRNLGVHISKVKSVSLDKWPLEQAEFMAKIGNDKANAHFEARLPEGRKPTENDSTYVLENFIRDKYERKMFVKPAPTESEKKKAAKKKKKKQESSSEEDSDSGSDSSDEEERAARKKKEAKKKAKEEAAAKEAAAAKAAAAAAAAAAANRDDDDSSDDEEARRKARKAAKKAKAEKEGGKKESKKTKSSVPPPAAAVQPNLVGNFNNLTVSNGADDDFGSFTAAAPPAAALHQLLQVSAISSMRRIHSQMEIHRMAMAPAAAMAHSINSPTIHSLLHLSPKFQVNKRRRISWICLDLVEEAMEMELEDLAVWVECQ